MLKNGKLGPFKWILGKNRFRLAINLYWIGFYIYFGNVPWEVGQGDKILKIKRFIGFMGWKPVEQSWFLGWIQYKGRHDTDD